MKPDFLLGKVSYRNPLLGGARQHGCMVTSIMGAWQRGSMAAWQHGSMVASSMGAWQRGRVAEWQRGSVAEWQSGSVAARKPYSQTLD